MKKNLAILPTYNIKKLVTYLVVLVIFYFLINTVWKNFESIKNANIELGFYTLFIIFITTGTLHIFNSFSWHFLTKSLRLKINFFENMRIWLLPNLSRYIPGVVWQYLGRTYLLSQHGIGKSQSVLLLALDAIFTFSIGSTVLVAAILFFNFPLKNLNYILFVFIPIPIFIALIFSNQKILRWGFGLINRFSKKKFGLPKTKFSAFWVLVLSIFTFSQFAVAGVCLFLIASKLYPLSLNLIPVFSGIYAGSWILGYISFFAPGGLGIQELSMTGLLSFFMPLPLATITSLVFRLMLIITEVLISLLVFIIKKKN